MPSALVTPQTPAGLHKDSDDEQDDPDDVAPPRFNRSVFQSACLGDAAETEEQTNHK